MTMLPTCPTHITQACSALHGGQLGRGTQQHPRIVASGAVKRRAGGEGPEEQPGDDDRDVAELPEGVSRRQFMLNSVALAALGAEPASNWTDGRTVVNSILGAYGLPQLPATKGYRMFDDYDEEYTFEYPTSWVRRNNMLRGGVYIANFQTADKLSVESFPLPEGVRGLDGGGGEAAQPDPALVTAVVGRLLNPGPEAGGDSRIELPPAKRIKSELRQVEGKTYLQLAYPSNTTTRSGYEVRRKNLACAGVKRGVVYAIAVSARSDQWTPDTAAQLQHIVETFRLR